MDPYCEHQWQAVEEQPGSPVTGRSVRECILCGGLEANPPIAMTIPARSEQQRRDTNGRGYIDFSAVPAEEDV
jgi:hypothetical protein